MAIHTDDFHTAHKEMREHAGALCDLAEHMPSLTEAERRLAYARVVAMLQSRVEPHTKLDEWLLYPAVADRLGDPLVTASMNYDHLAIRDWILKIKHTDPNDAIQLQRLLYGLDALIRVHVWKEDELFLAALESSSWLATGDGVESERLVVADELGDQPDDEPDDRQGFTSFPLNFSRRGNRRIGRDAQHRRGELPSRSRSERGMRR